MKFLIDRCAGRLIAQWLRSKGHDVVESRERGHDPGDRVLLEWAASESRILITIDADFGQLIFLENVPHCGLIRLPDVPAKERVSLIEDLLTDRREAQRIGERAKRYLIEKHRIDAGRIKVTAGEYNQKWAVELWLVPVGAVPPSPKDGLNRATR